jgi:transcriptional regulator with XRE-family HTH domain
MEKDQLLVAIGARIRALRMAKGFSHEGFAAAAGLDRAYYGGIERGERNVSIRNLVRIAATMGVEIGELFPPIQELSSSSTSA